MYKSQIIGTLPRSYRKCMCCVNNGIRVIQDEYHLISICSLYQNFPLSCKASFVITLFIALSSLMSSNDEYVNINLSKYVYRALDVHNIFNKL